MSVEKWAHQNWHCQVYMRRAVVKDYSWSFLECREESGWDCLCQTSKIPDMTRVSRRQPWLTIGQFVKNAIELSEPGNWFGGFFELTTIRYQALLSGPVASALQDIGNWVSSAKINRKKPVAIDCESHNIVRDHLLSGCNNWKSVLMIWQVLQLKSTPEMLTTFVS